MFESEKEQLVEVSLKLYNEKLIVGTWGNLSLRVKDTDGKSLYIVTPSGMEYEKTTINDLIVLDEEGSIVEGIRKPTSELKMHMRIYEEREEINAIIHTHSTFATAFAVAGVSIPMIVEDMVQHLGGDLRVAKYALPGTDKLADYIVEALSDRNGTLMKNHGAVGIGKTLEDAYKAAMIIEKTSKIYLYAKVLGHVHLLSVEDAQKMIEYYNTNYGQNNM
ncbi:class II aldolase/adducin family protein [Clostridium rectalis]|uniref:class II aldolase/adducin family protein n=1 Tax=Clostridium rectalis TaxID=2040295 RepID=UPI000F62DB44|nr:class II aldolase/adducin family protein [Clostridium rectalis]